MFSKTFGFLILTAAALYTSSAMALVDVELLYGRQWYQLQSTPVYGYSATDVDVAAHIDPIPLVPISFGVKADFGSIDHSDVQTGLGYSSVSTAAIAKAGLDIMAWVPLVPIVTPYVRLDIPVVGTQTIKGTAGGVAATRTSNINGFDLGIGGKFSLLPLIKVLVELDQNMESEKIKSETANGGNVTYDSSNVALNSRAFFVGVEVGL